MTGLDSRALRTAFGTFMTGVTVVTALDAEGDPLGFTANSFTSVSLDPPLVLVCLAKSSRNHDGFVAAGGFAVSVLAETQRDISNTFARPSDDRFADVDWHLGPHGSPIVHGCSAWFDCALHKAIEAGDHTILIGRVLAFDSTSSPGLGYARGAYVVPDRAMNLMGHHLDLVVSALIARNGEVLLKSDEHGGMALPETVVGPDESVSAALARLVDSTGSNAQPGFIYSVFEDAARKRQHLCFLCQTTDGDGIAGTFVPLERSALDDVSDPAILTLLERYVSEAQLGTFGIYYGNQTSGDVRAIV
ncbi:flavin reductase family protein [Tateyamaria omphalii]|uniref:flavin reductase n=1 Tax=Tateyamaria omphalii TaxID=299262 RepID=UPI001C98F6E4|nr:flavin reductase family protein [Tateyamaria omphalii]MBY5931501.1 flavin reductase family protein [Tateyamaria omphalii]